MRQTKIKNLTRKSSPKLYFRDDFTATSSSVYDPVLFPERLRRTGKDSTEVPNSEHDKKFKPAYTILTTSDLEGKALFIFDVKNTFRLTLHRVVRQKWYIVTINSLGAASSLLLMAYTPMRPESDGINQTVIVIEYVDSSRSDIHVLIHGRDECATRSVRRPVQWQVRIS